MNQPEHIVETRFIRVDGCQFKQPCTFIDGEQASFDQMESMGWKNLAQWAEQGKKWMARMSYPAGPEAWDRTEAARSKLVELLGDRQGEPSTQTLLLETYLQSNGWEPFLMDALNRYCPGVARLNKCVLMLTHVFIKGDQSIAFRLGDKNRFLFSLDKCRWYQVPVGSDHFDRAVGGELPVIEHVRLVPE